MSGYAGRVTSSPDHPPNLSLRGISPDSLVDGFPPALNDALNEDYGIV